jgi:hypothetical protein
MHKSFDIKLTEDMVQKTKLVESLHLVVTFFISSPFISVSNMFINFNFFLGHTQTIESVHKIIWI